MQIEAKHLFPFVIVHNKKLYVRTSKESQIGDIIRCLDKCGYTTEGKFYKIIECYAPNGFKGIIDDTGEPMGMHDNLGYYVIYRERGSKLKYLRLREVATSSDNLVKCHICGTENNGCWVTVDEVLVCHRCKRNDPEAEFVSKEVNN